MSNVKFMAGASLLGISMLLPVGLLSQSEPTLQELASAEEAAPIEEQVQLSEVNIEAAQFIDVEGHWAQTYIEDLALLGVVGGYSDGQFRPEKDVKSAELLGMLENAFAYAPLEFSGEVTRAAALKLIVDAAGIEVSSTLPNFLNVDPSDWYAPYTSWALSHDILSGANPEFDAGRSPSRAEVCKIIWKVLEYQRLN